VESKGDASNLGRWWDTFLFFALQSSKDTLF
jgi:hypothetical protein